MNKITYFICKLIGAVDFFIPKKFNLVVYNSYPDVSDNALAVFLYIIENYEDKQNIWLVKDKNFDRLINIIETYTQSKRYKIVTRDSFLGIWFYLRAKYVFFTHGLYSGASISKKHCVVNLWHGMPLKKVGAYDNKSFMQKSSFAISTSKFYQSIISKAFLIQLEHVLISGQPKNDLLFLDLDVLSKLNVDKKKYSFIILWTPTYRKSKVGDVRLDGHYEGEFPAINNEKLIELNSYLNELNMFMIIKLHPMDVSNDKKYREYSNISIITNDKFNELNVTLNSLLNNIDVLLTDFSSIYIDFLLLNRPIAFLCDDIEHYSASRGFVISNINSIMPGDKLKNIKELQQFLKDIHSGIDNYEGDRINVCNVLNEIKNNSCKNLLDEISFK